MEPVNTELQLYDAKEFRFEKFIIDSLKGRNYFAPFREELKRILKQRFNELDKHNLDIKTRYNSFFKIISDILQEKDQQSLHRVMVWKKKEIVINALLLECFLQIDNSTLGKIFSSLFSSQKSESLEVVKIHNHKSKDQYSLAFDIILKGTNDLFFIELKCGSKYPVEQYVKSFRLFKAFKNNFSNIKYLLITEKGFDNIGVLTKGDKWVFKGDDKYCLVNIDEYKKILDSYKKKQIWKEYIIKEGLDNINEFPLYFRKYSEIKEAFDNIIGSDTDLGQRYSSVRHDLQFTIELLNCYT